MEAKNASYVVIITILTVAILFGYVCLEGFLFMKLYNFAVIDGILKGGTTFKKINTIWEGICLYLLLALFFRNQIYFVLGKLISEEVEQSTLIQSILISEEVEPQYEKQTVSGR